ncbi:hypothetical protein H0W26_04695 [Candidatus Dependentiae bacterium]|nr:hypothetical protein [Candidatus Dependentiae bacterium]
MNKRYVYMLGIVVHVIGCVWTHAQSVELGFENIAITSVGCAEGGPGNDGTIVVTPQKNDSDQVTFIVNPGPNQIEEPTGEFTDLPAGSYVVRIVNTVTKEFIDATVVVQRLVPLTIRRVRVVNVRTSGEATGLIVLETRGGLGVITLGLERIDTRAFSQQQGSHVVGDELISLRDLPAGIYRITLQSEDECPPTRLIVQIVEPVV